MAKKSMLSDAADAVKSVAGAALGAAAAAATTVVVARVAGALAQGGDKLGRAAPALEQSAAEAVSAPILPKPRKRAAATRKATTAKKKVAAKKATKKPAKKPANKPVKKAAKKKPAQARRKKR
jgi:outer membrane biosynthesis protein TonB